MGDTSSSSHSRQDPSLLGYGFHGAIANSTPPANFFDQGGGGTYFGELEEAFMHQVASLRRTQQAATVSAPHHGDTKPFPTAAGATAATATATARPPPTLDIFPAWPMRSRLHTPKECSNVTADSTDDSESSSKNHSNHSSDQLGAAAAANMASQFEQASQQQLQHKNMATSSTPRTGKALDPKVIRRLAQNREAARKSRLRKKGLFLGGDPGASTSSGAAMFDVEYARWLDNHSRRLAELNGALHAHLADGDLRAIVDDALTHHDELFQLKAMAAKSDVFHLITGVWTTPAERCFLWMGGFRPSDLLKTLLPQLDPLTEQQVVGICSLQQSSQQAEEALSQGLEQLHQSLADTMAGGSLTDDANMSFMSQMALALGKLANLEGFVIQADNLRQQTLHQMHRILTVRQAARCLLAIGEYHNRLRALSSLWASRPREILVTDEGNCEISIAAQPSQNQFSTF
ncbi:bZIP transcription factor family protein [Zea mays]|uniref:BZIP transcription factor family protein n=1 Tax=Zea mays TaxID=4577 RepID=A0A1D6QHQ8_MAIZE|nr:bZIP transcription factor family protein [Zea mays]